MTNQEQIDFVNKFEQKLLDKLEQYGVDYVKNLTGKMRQLMQSKGDDYAGQDRLSNFKNAGSLAGITPEQQCLSLMAVKVARLGTLLQANGKGPNYEPLQDSAIDLQVYGVLLTMLLDEQDTTPLKWWETNE